VNNGLKRDRCIHGREVGSAPGCVFLIGEIPAHVYEGEDVDRVLVVVDGIDYALTLHDEFPNVLGIGFGDLPADARQLGELNNRTRP